MKRDRLVGMTVWLAAALVAVTPLSARQVRVEADIPDGYVDRDFAFRLSLSGALEPGERIAVVLGDEDVSGVMAAGPDGLRYQAGLLPLPVGATEVVVHRVDAEGTWHRLSAFPLRVRSQFGVEEKEFDPGLDLTLSSQPAQGEDPEPATPSDVPTVLDGSLRLDGSLVHRDFTSTASAVVVGTSEREQRLRYGTLEERAPLLDLASYEVGHEQGPVALTLGHIRSGDQRHLINGFGSRGATMTVAPSPRLQVGVSANAGRQEVGWGNLLGVGQPDHRILSANVGVEALERPGALRLDVGWMDGSVLPVSGFNRGSVTDAEASNGMSFRLRAAGLDRRLRLDAGWARSTFDNPLDSELSAGVELVEVEETTRDARYLDADLEVLRRIGLGGSRTLSLSVGFQHERVDPLYRSVGAGARADVLQDQVSVNADVAGVTIQGSFSSAEDNLDEIPSILKTDTERRGVTVGVPLTRLAGTPWLPSLQYRNDRTHQAGVELPTDGGFSPGHVPDQVSVNQSLSFDWRTRVVTFRYQLNHSDQDNRQEGREDADFKTLTSGFGLGLTPTRTVRIGVDLNLERADNLGADERDNTRRWGANASWQPLERSTLAVRFSDTFRDDDQATREQAGRTVDVKWSSRLPTAGGLGGTWFVRWYRNESQRIDRLRDLTQDRTRWTLTLGANLSWSAR